MEIAQLGHRFVVEPASTRLTSEEADLLAELKPAGIMLRQRNFFSSPNAQGVFDEYEEMLDQLRSLLHEVRQHLVTSRFIISIDHEGGRVVRPPQPITRFPYPAYWGARQDEVVRAIAVELRSLGVNVFYGPVADIHSNLNNPVIGERALGTTPQVVCERAVAYHALLKEAGLITCAKHFPGHGDTSQDSHFELPTLPYSLDELRGRELLPFKALIEAGVPMVMTGHLLIPKLDSTNPATISPRIMRELLRDELGFTGVVIADAIGMQAILPRVLTNEFAEQILAAQVDLVCVAGNSVTLRTAREIASTMCKALDEDRAQVADFEASRHRVMALLKDLPPPQVVALPRETFAAHHALAEALEKNSAWSVMNYIPQGF